MPSPKDFESVPAPNYAAYSDPRLGLEIGSRIAALPEQAFAARQRARTEMLQQPVLDANGNVITDPQQLAKELIKRGGYDAAKELYPLLWKQTIMNAPDPMNPANSNEPVAPRPTAPPPTPTAKQQITGDYPPQQQRPPAGAPGPAPGGVGFSDRFNFGLWRPDWSSWAAGGGSTRAAISAQPWRSLCPAVRAGPARRCADAAKLAAGTYRARVSADASGLCRLCNGRSPQAVDC
jgi:hypothetical protein